MLIFSWLFVLTLASGCTDLSAVSTFASAYKDANRQVPKIADDMYRSCANYADYVDIAHGKYDVKVLLKNESTKCDQYRDLAPRIVAANRILADYLAALDAMANNQSPAYDGALEGLPDKLSGSTAFDPGQTKAFAGLAKFVLDASTNAYRCKKLADVIQAHNADVAAVTTALRSIVAVDYGTLLDNEETGLRDMFGTPLVRRGARHPLTALLVDTEWRKSQERVESRRVAAQAYGKILTEIAEGHQELYTHREALDSRETAAAALKRAAAMADLAATMSAGL